MSITAKIEHNVTFVMDCGMLEAIENWLVPVLTFMLKINKRSFKKKNFFSLLNVLITD